MAHMALPSGIEVDIGKAKGVQGWLKAMVMEKKAKFQFGGDDKHVACD
jgi:hypothetical protein